MEEMHGELVCWAMESGVRLSGVEPRMIPNRGTGMFATRKIKVINPPIAFSLSNLETVRRDLTSSPYRGSPHSGQCPKRHFREFASRYIRALSSGLVPLPQKVE